MRFKICVLFLLILSLEHINARGINGGINCAVCTIVMGMATQVAQVREESLFNATERLCNYLPHWAIDECLCVINKTSKYFPIMKYIGPDIACLLSSSCTVDKNAEFCHLFPLHPSQKDALLTLKNTIQEKDELDFCSIPVVKDICDILNNSFVNHKPAEDIDGDGFSIVYTLRGANWKGKDCDDTRDEVYPGRKPINSDIFQDSNCNGIYGVDPQSHEPWEDILCNGSSPRGIMYIGDSVSAHFHFPQLWMNPLEINFPTTDGVDAVLNELDWPQLGFATGFINTTVPILIKGKTDSIYLRLKERNLCNHRDYQNVAQNGASSYEGVSNVHNFKRSSLTDYPVLGFYAMIGNDVCNNFAANETLDNTTPPEEFRMNVLKTLQVVDEKVPRGSHIVIIGLVHADFIYPAMAEKLHPLGKLNKNVRYKDVYNWFNCLQIGPCTGWLNSNETLRKLTTQKADILNNVLRNIAGNESFKNFDIHYMDNPIDTALKDGKLPIAHFLDPVDSLHPNQLAQPIITDIIWSYLENLTVDILGPRNPNNDKIKEVFGAQGGH